MHALKAEDFIRRKKNNR